MGKTALSMLSVLIKLLWFAFILTWILANNWDTMFLWVGIILGIIVITIWMYMKRVSK